MYDDRTAMDNPIDLANDIARQLKCDADPAIVEYPLTHFRRMRQSYQQWLFHRLSQEMAIHGMICSFQFEYQPGHLHYILLQANLVVVEDP